MPRAHWLCFTRLVAVLMGQLSLFFFFQAEDGIRDFCLSRGLGDVYKRQLLGNVKELLLYRLVDGNQKKGTLTLKDTTENSACLLYTSDAADEEDSGDLGGRRIIKKKKSRQ
ncbi:hypothetical protein CDFC105_93858 [Clostridioides difficile]|nr:hypothetical protein CDFC105_93858 [Clostridioides difficile]